MIQAVFSVSAYIYIHTHLRIHKFIHLHIHKFISKCVYIHREFHSIMLGKSKNRPAKLNKVRELNTSRQVCKNTDETGLMNEAVGLQAVFLEDPGRGKLLQWCLAGAHPLTSRLSLPAEAGFLPKSPSVLFSALSRSYTYPLLHYTRSLLLGGSLPWSAISSLHTEDDFLSLQAGSCNALQRDTYTGRDTVMSRSITGHIASVIYLHQTSKKNKLVEKLFSSAVISLWFIPAKGAKLSA